MNALKFFQVGFLPQSPDLGLLVLRFWLGGTLLIVHGLDKLHKFSHLAAKFPDPLHIGSKYSLMLAIFAEAICSVFLIIGLFTRFAALCCIILLAVAFFMVHHAALGTTTGSGELAFIYLAGYVALFLAGGGRFSVDAGLSGR
jgi:putative oxidoreductase